ncbi:MAG: hypothetical protein PVI06_21180 [Desulfobacterales bacterium]|jgi:hypothetical protein
MKWIELIQLRSVDSNRKLLESKLQRLINEVTKKRKKKAIMAYCRLSIDTDFSIHIFHDSKEVETTGSRLGLRLVDALKEFGLVNHSIWLEMNSK